MTPLNGSRSVCSFVTQFRRTFIPLLLLASTPVEADAAFTGLTRVATGLSQPVFSTFAPGDSSRLFIATLGAPDNNTNATATIRVLDLSTPTPTLQSTPYLSIPGLNTNSEGGFLGLAFHPDFQTNRKFYAYVTANDSDPNTPFSSYIREYTAPSASSPTANPGFNGIMEWTQPQDNHNGGFIGFSPKDGYLYIMSGDGGNGNDQGTGHTEPGGNAQDITNNFLGKTLRIDVDRDDFTSDAARDYGIPYDIEEDDVIVTPGNPFAPNEPGMTDPTGDNEIWAFGLRNPFRAGFDRATGDLWIGDVGQGRREEIDMQPAGSAGGEDYGWRRREGFIQTPGVGGPLNGAVQPVWDYKQPDSPDLTPADTGFTGQAVVGGIRYRGPDPSLQGVYFFADTVSNQIWTLRLPEGGNPLDVDNVTALLPKDVGSPNQPVAITEDAVGNLYVTYLSGSVYRINTNEFVPGDFNGDAAVDGLDLGVWENGFGSIGASLRTSGDADADNDVDGADFLVWQRNVGYSSLNTATASSAAVPEPTSAALALMGAIAVVASCATRK